MKAKMTKIMGITVMAACLTAGAATCMAAETAIEAASEAAAEAATEAVAEETVEAAAQTQAADEAYLYGEWNNGSLLPTIFLPDGYAYASSDTVIWERVFAYEISGSQIVVDVDSMSEENKQGITAMTAELQPVETVPEEDRGAGVTEETSCLEPGKDMALVVTGVFADDSDPLSPAEVEQTAYVYKEKCMREYLAVLLAGKTWEMNGNTVKIETKENTVGQMTLELNGGEQTGFAASYEDGTVKFKWGESDEVTYKYVTADADSFTLAYAEDASKTFVFTKVSENNAEVPEAETN